MPKITVYVSASLKARMDRYRDTYNWSGTARAGWEAMVEFEEEREAAEKTRQETLVRIQRFRGATGTVEEREAERAAWEVRKAELRQLWKDEDG